MNLSDERRNRSKLMVDLGVLIVSMVGVTVLDVKKDSSAFEAFMVDTLAPVQQSLVLTKNEMVGLVDHYLTNVDASKKNIILQKEIDDLNNELFKMQETSLENKRLKALLRFGGQISLDKVLAQVVAWDTSSDFRAIRINKGLKDGIQLEAPVVTAKGLVGHVYRISDHYADILTIIDSNNRVDGMIQRTRTLGIVEGRDDRCFMKYVTRTEPIILDDVVITPGLSNIYPKGIVIGRVVKIERESFGIEQSVEIEPAVNFGTLEDVVVLSNPQKGKKQIEWDALDLEELGGEK